MPNHVTANDHAPLWARLRPAVAGAWPEQAAQIVLAQLGITDVPVGIEAILKMLGVDVQRVVSPGYAGAVVATGNAATITVKSTDAPVRQRFTMAHELGHLLMHPLGTMYRDISFAGTPQEAQANQFAAGMLMPLWMVEAAAMRPGMTGEKLCEMFDVSEAAMKIRIQQLRGVPIRWG